MSHAIIPYDEITLTHAPGVYKTAEGFKYPWAHAAWKIQQQVHWLPEEVPMADDVKDWSKNLNLAEKNLLTQIFRFFTQGDVDVADCYMQHYSRIFKPTEVKMMLAAFAAMETVHIHAYAFLLDTVNMPESEFSAFLEYEAMAAKSEYLTHFSTATPLDVAKTLAQFGAFTEGLQLFASFAMLMNFPRHGKMKGMGQIISWSIRDESLHADSIIRLFNTYVAENDLRDGELRSAIYNMCENTVELEDRFIDLAFEMGDIEGLSRAEMKNFIRYTADQRLYQLGYDPLYDHDFSGKTAKPAHPLPWFLELTAGQEHMNFFEGRATEYSKSATSGSWENVWSEFDASEAARGVEFTDATSAGADDDTIVAAE